MRQHTGDDQWSLYWTARDQPVPCHLVPVLAGWANLEVPVTGTVHGTPWISHISYHQAQVLALRLAAACLVVVAYLSGLRLAEVLHLRTGCCPGTGGRRHRHGSLPAARPPLQGRPGH